MSVFIPDYMLTLPRIVSFFKAMGYSLEIILLVYKCLFILMSLFVTLGFFPRISAFFLLFLQIFLVKGFSFYAYGVDYFTSMSLVYLVLIPSGDQYSLMPKRKQNENLINRTPYWRLLQIHLSMSYFFGGLGKVLGFNWRNGEAIWKTLNLPYVNNDFNFDVSFLAAYPFVLVIIGWSVVVIELCYPLFIWFKKTRRCWLFLAIAMHIGIALVLNLYFFSALMIIWNISAFYFCIPQRAERWLVIDLR